MSIVRVIIVKEFPEPRCTYVPVVSVAVWNDRDKEG